MYGPARKENFGERAPPAASLTALRAPELGSETEVFISMGEIFDGNYFDRKLFIEL